VFGRKDIIREPCACRHELVCFTDEPKKVPQGWAALLVSAGPLGVHKRNREIKARIHHYTSRELTAYMDGQFSLRKDPLPLFSLLRDADIALFANPWRNCVYGEIEACLRQRRGDPAALREQQSRYLRAGLPRNVGLYATGVILRRMSPSMREFGELWWEETNRGSERDQVSFSYLVWKLGLKVAVIPGSVYSNLFFKYHGHAR
jgi:hypothetical protein